MAANYWASTQKQFWLFSRDKLADLRDDANNQYAKVIEQYPYPDRRLVFIFLREKVLQLAKRLVMRQQCVGTALVYIQRYLHRRPFQEVNLYILVATAFYLSSKTEESPHHIRLVASEARQAWPEFVPGDVSRLGEMEFCLISDMRSQLIVWHPYRFLLALKEQDFTLAHEDLGLAWSIINDSFLTDLPLTCPPHLIATTALLLAITFNPSNGTPITPLPPDATMNYNQPTFSSLGGRQGTAEAFSGGLATVSTHQQNGAPINGVTNNNSGVHSQRMQKLVRFLVESDLDIEAVIMATQEMISLYEVWEQHYNDKAIKEAISKCLKGRGLDN